MKVEFDVGDCHLLQGILVALVADEEGKPHLKIIDHGEPMHYARVGMLQVALDRARARQAAQWGE